MLLILILTNFLFSISSIDGVNLDYLIKDSGLAANKKSNLLLKNSINPADYFIGPGDEFFINVISNNLSINKFQSSSLGTCQSSGQTPLSSEIA